MKIDTHKEDLKSLWFHFDLPKDEEVFPVRIASIGHLFSSDPNYLLDTACMKRMNDSHYHSFQYLINGSGLFRYHDGNTEMECDILPQHLFLMSHDLDFSFRFTSGDKWEWMWIVMEGEMADRVVASSTTKSRVWKLAPDSLPLLSLKFLFQTIFHSPITTSQMILYGCEFLLRFKDTICMNNLSPQDALLEKSRQIIIRNIKRINVESFAKYYGYSNKYFQKYFREIVGITPGAFIQEQKISYAKMFLKNSSKNISEIAYLAGFSDGSHLCRVFRKHLGQSPKEWRFNSK